MRDRAALRRVPLLELLQLERNVRDGRVDLAGEEVALPKGGEELRQLSAAFREELEHEEERHDTRVGLREVSEVVVRRNLAREDSAFLPHPVLDEGMSHPVDERHAACLLD